MLNDQRSNQLSIVMDHSEHRIKLNDPVLNNHGVFLQSCAMEIYLFSRFHLMHFSTLIKSLVIISDPLSIMILTVGTRVGIKLSTGKRYAFQTIRLGKKQNIHRFTLRWKDNVNDE